jgi:hypothetical protein
MAELLTTTPRMTARYAHVIPEDQRAAVKLLNRKESR